MGSRGCNPRKMSTTNYGLDPDGVDRSTPSGSSLCPAYDLFTMGFTHGYPKGFPLRGMKTLLYGAQESGTSNREHCM